MKKISKDFLKGNLLICGCTKSDNAYYKRLYKHFRKNGINVLAMPTTPESSLGFSTYMNYEDLPVTPDCAYVLSPKDQSLEIIQKMNELGVKKYCSMEKSQPMKKFWQSVKNMGWKYGWDVHSCSSQPEHAIFMQQLPELWQKDGRQSSKKGACINKA